ncbi:hypothetical protein PGB90_008735 [Kerria lacca]
MCEAENNSDLEEGEIREDVFEDISECSLSDVLSVQDPKEDSDIEQLREEALKSLHEKEEITEEELYRLEALKSLLLNIETSEIKQPEKSTGKKIRRRKRKKKMKNNIKQKQLKHKKLTIASENQNLKISTIPLQWSNRDILKIDNSTAESIINKENQTDKNNKLKTRLWYPKTEFALTDTSFMQNMKVPVDKDFNNKNSHNFVSLPKVSQNVPTAVKHIKCDSRSKIKVGEQYTASIIPPVFKSSQFKKISKHHIRKFNAIRPIANKYMIANSKKGKYKIVNASNYVLRRTFGPKNNIENRSNVLKSTNSTNGAKCQFHVNPKEFVINLEEKEESDKEEEFKNNAQDSLNEAKDNEMIEYIISSDVKINENHIKNQIDNVTSLNTVVRGKNENHKLPINIKNSENNDEIPSSTDNNKQNKNILRIKNEEISKLKNSSITTSTSTRSVNFNDGNIQFTEMVQQPTFEFPTAIERIKIERVWSEKYSYSPIEEIPCGLTELESQKQDIKSIQCEDKVETKNINIIRVVDANDTNKIVSRNQNSSILVNAESNLIEIRAKLFSDLGELDKMIKQNTAEKEKLRSREKKLIELKSSVLKLEEDIKIQQYKLSCNLNSMYSLFKGVATRIETCIQLKKICLRAGREIIGSQ